MHTFLDSKAMAKALRTALAERHVDITHSDSLELVARQFGLANWNILSARIEAAVIADAPLPAGWKVHHGGGYPLHSAGLDRAEPGTVRIASISSSDVTGLQHATLMQSIAADAYRGHKLRFTAELRGEDVDAGTIWLRIDPRGGGRPIRFDNMMTRTVDGALKGSFGWTERSIVLDVPEEAGSIHYGPLLRGVGQLWARHLRLDIAPPDTATTDTNLPDGPTNLGFGSDAA